MIKNTLLPVSEFVRRRTDFITQMPKNSIAIIFAAKEVTRSNDTEYLFCQDKNFYYLTGFNEPDAVLVLIHHDNKDQTHGFEQSILFSRDKNSLEEIWHGRRIGQQAAMALYGVDCCYPLSELDDHIISLIENRSSLLYFQQTQALDHQQLLSWISTIQAKSRSGIKAPNTLVNCSDVIDEMRLHKSDAEIDIMRQANQISAKAHQRAMLHTKAGIFEYQIEAELLHEFATHGARYAAYNSIVASGDNANILHYTDNDDVLKNGELLLIDAGAELAGYAADITRTFPVNGTFNTEQAAIYQLVLDCQNLAISTIKPKQTLAALNKLAHDFLTKGLHKLGILTGHLSDLLAEKASKKYFIHGIGHWLGLDVHDVGDYHANEQRQQCRPFAQGMVLTIEPGLYIPLNDESVEKKWRGIAVRIEDNILVTATGYENLSAKAPKTIDDIEHLMKR